MLWFFYITIIGLWMRVICLWSGGVIVQAYIGDIAEEIPCVPYGTLCSHIDDLFKKVHSLQGIVIEGIKLPTALITRTNFYQKMGTQYGYNLYMNKPIELIANRAPLKVDYYTSVIEVSKLAMARTEKEIYDNVIIHKDNLISGVVSIKSLLMKVSEIQVELASYLNPLTRLPGNNLITENLNRTFELNKEFSILYIDLDRFKAYNDSYGFNKGDELLQFTADVLGDFFDKIGCFLGHIGGDDFIIILNHYAFSDPCNKLITYFDEHVNKFYDQNHLSQGYIYMENREGKMEEIPLVTISIAVVTNYLKRFHSVEEIISEATRMKKICKLSNESCFYSETICCNG